MRSAPVTQNLRTLLATVRPSQWPKNLACFAGAVFSSKLTEPFTFLAASKATLAFCAVSSATYIINDLFDQELDRAHPQKRHRPVASGTITPPQALVLSGILGAAGLALGLLVRFEVTLLLLAYLILQCLYSWRLKRWPVLDVLSIAAGFLLRILAGTQAIQVPASPWILSCTLFLALFLGFGKRRAELNACAITSASTRTVLNRYTRHSLDWLVAGTATLAAGTYTWFSAVAHPGHILLPTAVPVIFGLARYVVLVEKRGEGEAPESVLLRDRPIQIAIVVWIALCLWILY